MKFILFTKMLKNHNMAQLVRLAHELKLDGYDLCLRPGYVVNPDNALSALPDLAKDCRKEGIDIPMVTGKTTLLNPSDPESETLLMAMDKADVRMLKLGYFLYGRHKGDTYWSKVDEVRKMLEGWEKLAKKYQVKICYHTHQTDEDGPHYMGSSCAGLMDLLQGFDPAYLGAYIDAGHMSGGEAFDLGVSITNKYLSAVAVKDICAEWDEKKNRPQRKCKAAGKGHVEWDLVFSELVRIDFKGPISIHAEYENSGEKEFFELLPSEVAFFRKQREEAEKKKTPKYGHLPW